MINGRYKIEAKAGEGRSTVYLCEDTLKKNSLLAIKVLPSTVDDEERNAFRDEYFLLQKLNHPNIISVFDYGVVVSLDEDDEVFNIRTGSSFFTLEYFDGVELYESKDLDREDVLVDIICQISSVLYYLHQSSYIYYDLKSENILIREQDNQPVIKFIDFGLAARGKDINNVSARGTSEYIAPEILRKEDIDHRVDLYSLGILLYKILYGRFPFSVKDQLAIYKAHLNDQFEFPESSYDEKLVNLVKVLLSKDPDERYFTSIGVINELAPGKLYNFRKDWIRVQTFAARRDSFSIISTYIEQQEGGEVLTIKGAEGAGKTTLLQELNYKYPSSFILSADQRTVGNIWQLFLRKILYRENIYSGADKELLEDVRRLLAGQSLNLAEELKTVIIKLISKGRFTLLIDNFNLISDFDLDIFIQIIPILQVNKIKVVLTEDASTEYKSKAVNNLRVINLNPFTESEVTEFVQNSFAEFYPSEEVKKAVILYSDLLPGSIEIFLKDLIVLDIIKFAVNGPSLSIDKNIDGILQGSQEDIYRFRIENLDSESRADAEFLSLFDVNLDIKSITLLTDRTERDITRTLVKLAEANIIHLNPIINIIQFTSRGIKEYIYSTIDGLKEAQLKTARLIAERIPDFNKNELARHWESAGEYELAYDTLKDELKKADNASALAYEKGLLEHLNSLPLNFKSQTEVKISLSNCYFQIGEHQASLALINELLKVHLEPEEELSLKILKGKALISSQNLEEGKKLLKSVLTRISSDERRNEILAEITEAEFEMANYDEAETLSDKLVEDEHSLIETRGKIYRIKGLIELFKKNNPQGTIGFLKQALKEFQKKRQLAKVASMQNNLGNIYNIVGEREEAESHWNKALEINSSIGNLLQNAIILLNLGVYNFEICNYEKAIEYYLEAESLFKTLGDKNNLGITFINLGEVYSVLCDYEKAIDILNKASEMFDLLDNKIEQGEAEFLLGRLYYTLGDKINLNRILKKYSGYSFNLGKTEFNYDYLKLLSDLLNNKASNIEDNLSAFRDRSNTFSDNFLFCEIQIRLIEQLIQSQNYERALDELSLDNFVNICKEHIYYNAYRRYLTGRIMELYGDEKVKPHLEHFEEAYNLINGISITELTWKILFSLFRTYSERGNITKMIEFKNYTKQTINYIADQIKSPVLKKDYLENPERLNALQILESEIT